MSEATPSYPYEGLLPFIPGTGLFSLAAGLLYWKDTFDRQTVMNARVGFKEWLEANVETVRESSSYCRDMVQADSMLRKWIAQGKTDSSIELEFVTQTRDDDFAQVSYVVNRYRRMFEFWRAVHRIERDSSSPEIVFKTLKDLENYEKDFQHVYGSCHPNAAYFHTACGKALMQCGSPVTALARFEKANYYLLHGSPRVSPINRVDVLVHIADALLKVGRGNYLVLTKLVESLQIMQHCGLTKTDKYRNVRTSIQVITASVRAQCAMK